MRFLISLTPAACSRSHEVVGVRISKENDRSGRTVTLAGTGTPGVIWAVRALNSCKSWSTLAYCTSDAECRYLAEVHALDSFAAQGRANWRTRTCLARSYDQLDDLISCRHFSRHLESSEVEIAISRFEASNTVTEATKGQIRGTGDDRISKKCCRA
jgi:hypothetical protein